MKKTRKVEIFRLLEDNTWDTIMEDIPACPDSRVEAEVGKLIEGLIRQAQHRDAVLMGLYNDKPNLDADDPRR